MIIVVCLNNYKTLSVYFIICRYVQVQDRMCQAFHGTMLVRRNNEDDTLYCMYCTYMYVQYVLTRTYVWHFGQESTARNERVGVQRLTIVGFHFECIPFGKHQ